MVCSAGAGTGRATRLFNPMPEAMTWESWPILPSGPGTGSERTMVTVASTSAPSARSTSCVKAGGFSIDSPGSWPSAASDLLATVVPSTLISQAPTPRAPSRVGPPSRTRAASATLATGPGKESSQPTLTPGTALCSSAMTWPSASW